MNTIRYISVLLVSILVLASCGGPAKIYLGKKSSKTKARAYTHAKKNRSSKSKTRGHTKRVKKLPSKTMDAQRTSIVRSAKKYLGIPYRYGGKSARGGFDCSGFTSHVYTEAGLNVRGSSRTQAKLGTKKNLNQVDIGDLIVFGNNGKVSHVGIVADVGSNSVKVIHSTSSRGVVIDDITASDYWQKKYMYARDIVGR